MMMTLWIVLLALVGFLTSGITASILIKREILGSNTKPVIWLVGTVAAIAAGFSKNIAVALLVIFFVALIIFLIFMAENQQEKLLGVKIGQVLAIAPALAIVVSVISEAIKKFGKGEMLYYLLAPVFYYLCLSVYGRSLTGNKERKKICFDFATPLIVTVVLGAIAVGLYFYATREVL